MKITKRIIILVLALTLLLTGCQKIEMEMRFDEMRDATKEENINNAVSGALMAANKDYVAFFDQEYGLVVYDREKDRYDVVEKYRSDNLQIQNNRLYFRRYDVYPK